MFLGSCLGSSTSPKSGFLPLLFSIRETVKALSVLFQVSTSPGCPEGGGGQERRREEILPVKLGFD